MILDRRSSSDDVAIGDRGVTAVFMAILLIPLLSFVALAIDISSLTNTRQDLWDTLDASALAGASLLPDGVAANNAALTYANANDPGLVPGIEFFCIVADNGGTPSLSQIPAVCDPGPGPYNAGTYPGLACDGEICAIPCDPLPPSGDVCNTMRVSAGQSVDYNFAPVFGVNQGNTGVLNSASCKGACGVESTAPADIALVLDRTGSMGAADVVAVVDASQVFLELLSPSLHDVALGTMGRGHLTPGPCPTTPSPSKDVGPWVPVSLRNDYDLTDVNPPSSPPDLNPASALVQGITCLTQSATNTNLGDSIFAAGDHLLTSGRPGVTKGILFMTDGEANQPAVASPCDYAKTQAAAVEAADVAIITVAYRLQGVTCGSEPATTVLAAMASDPISGAPTADDGGDGPGGEPGGCNTVPSIISENNDGDHFLCAPSPATLASVFAAATDALLIDLDGRTRLVRLP